MGRSLEELRRLERQIALNMAGQRWRKRRNLDCEACGMPMPHMIAIGTGGHLSSGTRWECLGCGEIKVEEAS